MLRTASQISTHSNCVSSEGPGETVIQEQASIEGGGGELQVAERMYRLTTRSMTQCLLIETAYMSSVPTGVDI